MDFLMILAWQCCGKDLFKAGENSQRRSGQSYHIACSDTWKDNHIYSLILYSFCRNKHLKMMDHNLMSVDRERRGET